MEAVAREIRIYVTSSGHAPFAAWISELGDRRAKARIFNRIDRVRLGNFGDCRSVGGGVYELRVDEGPGYRVYLGLLGTTVVLLLCAGSKKTQRQDVETAHGYWKELGRDAHDKLR